MFFYMNWLLLRLMLFPCLYYYGFRLSQQTVNVQSYTTTKWMLINVNWTFRFDWWHVVDYNRSKVNKSWFCCTEDICKGHIFNLYFIQRFGTPRWIIHETLFQFWNNNYNMQLNQYHYLYYCFFITTNISVFGFKKRYHSYWITAVE